ncbi:HOG (high osmolarity glycerol) pathway protein [Xylographa parallela]|nr:HOG (high osmolarity glycerol) pathway protein [Xylographa parallela]
MAAVLSPTSSSPVYSSRPDQPPSLNTDLSSLPPILTNHPQKRSKMQRPLSYAQNRMSSYSTTSNLSQKPSRPPSHVFPTFHSSLSYALVKDFAYPLSHPFHYGPPAESSATPSGQSTPAYDSQRRLSDPPSASWENSKSHWTAGAWGGDGHLANEQLPQMAYGDDNGHDHGPPYSEDEDLHSPIVVSSRHKKTKSAYPNIAGGLGKGRGRSPGRSNSMESSRQANQGKDRGYYAGTNGDGSETYYISEADEMADGPGGEIVTYPAGQARQSNSMLFPHTYHSPREAGDQSQQRISTYETSSDNERSAGLEPGSFNNESRYSRDYQFTIASPDEEMHGKAVALFDFARENENELPLIEGQVIWVSYRHGQGWLVAEDPKTRDKGLVPEEYVRLLRDIEGGWTSLSSEINAIDQTALLSPEPSASDSTNQLTPTGVDSGYGHSVQTSNGSNGVSGEKRPPVVSSFSTSSKDLNPYPHPLLGTQTGQQPPQVNHIGSQSTTPTVTSPIAPMSYRSKSADGSASTKTNTGPTQTTKESEDEDDDASEEEEDDSDESEEEPPKRQR